MSSNPFARLLAGASLLICLEAAAAPPPPPGVVRIYCDGVAGAGVVYGDRVHVMTAASLVQSGRGVEVIFADGARIDAETVVLDREHGVALLALERAAPVEPLALGALPAPGDGLHGLLPADGEGKQRTPPARIPGTVVAVGEESARVALPSGEDDIGAPLVDAAGQLVGLVRHPGPVATVIRPEQIAALYTRAQAEPDARYKGQGVFMLRSGWMMRADGEGLSHGPLLSMDLLAYDRFGLTARMGALFGDAPGGDPAGLVGAETVGFVTDLELNGRFGITPSAPLQIVAGVGWSQIGWSSRGHVLDGDRLVEQRVDDDLSRPYLRLGLGVSDLVELGYSLEVDLDDPGRSAHRFGLTIGF